MKIRVLKRFGQWHFWCPCCMGGDWYPSVGTAWDYAQRHIQAQHRVPAAPYPAEFWRRIRDARSA